MSVVVLLVMCVTVTSAAFMVGQPRLGPGQTTLLLGAALAGTMLISYLARGTIEMVRAATERAKGRGLWVVFFYLFVGFGLIVALSGGEEGIIIAQFGLLVLLLIHLLHAYDPKGRGRAMVTVVQMAAVTALAGGPPAVLAVVAALVGLPMFLVLHHHEQMRELYRIGRAPTPGAQIFFCLLFGGLMAGWCGGWFSWVGDPAGFGFRESVAVSAPRDPGWVTDLLEAVAMLALVVIVCAWAIRKLRGRGAGSVPKAESLGTAVPSRERRVAVPWTAPPPDAGPRRRIIHLYLRLLEFLQSRGQRRPPYLTPREFAARLDRAPLHEATELFCAARYTSRPIEEGDVARFEAAARDVRAAF